MITNSQDPSLLNLQHWRTLKILWLPRISCQAVFLRSSVICPSSSCFQLIVDCESLHYRPLFTPHPHTTFYSRGIMFLLFQNSARLAPNSLVIFPPSRMSQIFMGYMSITITSSELFPRTSWSQVLKQTWLPSAIIYWLGKFRWSWPSSITFTLKWRGTS